MGFDPRMGLQTREIWSKQLEQSSQVVPPAAGPLINIPWYVAAPVTLILVEFTEITFTVSAFLTAVYLSKEYLAYFPPSLQAVNLF